MKREKIPGEFVTSATVSEVIVSTGIQLVHLAHDLAFTDAAFGEAWAVETANRLASLSELLNIVYKRMPRRTLEIVIDFPDGMIGQVSINPNFKREAEEPLSKDKGSTDKEGGSQPTIDDFPF